MIRFWRCNPVEDTSSVRHYQLSNSMNFLVSNVRWWASSIFFACHTFQITSRSSHIHLYSLVQCRRIVFKAPVEFRAYDYPAKQIKWKTAFWSSLLHTATGAGMFAEARNLSRSSLDIDHMTTIVADMSTHSLIQIFKWMCYVNCCWYFKFGFII